MRILVTGANGYLGQGIVKQLLDDGINVIATDLEGEYIDQRAIKRCANLFDIDDPFAFFDKPDVLLHLAWRDGFKHDSENHLVDLPKHYAFLKKMIYGGVTKIAVMGSVHEVGFYEGSVNENTPTNPQSLYGISKNALRQAIEIKAQEKQITMQWIR